MDPARGLVISRLIGLWQFRSTTCQVFLSAPWERQPSQMRALAPLAWPMSTSRCYRQPLQCPASERDRTHRCLRPRAGISQRDAEHSSRPRFRGSLSFNGRPFTRSSSQSSQIDSTFTVRESMVQKIHRLGEFSCPPLQGDCSTASRQCVFEGSLADGINGLKDMVDKCVCESDTLRDLAPNRDQRLDL